MHAKRRERILDRAISYIRIFGKNKKVGEPIAKELEELKANRLDAVVRDVLLAEITDIELRDELTKQTKLQTWIIDDTEDDWEAHRLRMAQGLLKEYNISKKTA